MKRTYLIPVLLIFLGLASCGDSDETTTVDLNLKLLYNNEPLVMFDEYQYPDGGPDIFFTRFSFFLSDFNLSSEGVAQEAEDIAYLNPSDQLNSTSASEAGVNYQLQEIPSNIYDELSFCIGVPENLNAMTPADFSNNDVLANTGEYWAGWQSYVFAKIEGKIDVDGDGTFETGVSLHLGGDDAFRCLSLSNSTPLEINPENPIFLEIDLAKLFEDDNGFVMDITETPNIHSLEQAPQAMFLMNNFARAMAFRF